MSSFIGRKREIAEVSRLLGRYRLLCLTGPGGCGKTRLAIQVARELSLAYSGGTWLVEFAPLADPALVPQAVASTLGVHEQAGQSLVSALTSHLQTRQALLLLDNCEHLIDACAHLSQALLAACQGVRLLATSREPLGVPGEAVWSVPPLTLPAPQPWRGPASQPASLAIYEQSEAIQLFVARASAASPGYELTSQNAPWTANICRRLDGVPLAIELAAARARAMSVRQIAEHLDDRFKLLSGGPRTAPLRQRTLEATLDWSHTLLSQDEQRLFRRLSVFSGGWSLEAAGQVGMDMPDLLPVLAGLVNKSLVVMDQLQGESRYHYLETIRQYAWEKLAQAGETRQIRGRHLEYFTLWAEQAESRLSGRDQPEWVKRFSTEHDNLRAALEWGQQAELVAELSLRLAAACGHFWKIRGFLSEGRMHLSAALGRSDSQQFGLTRAQALIKAANLSYLQSDFPATRPNLEEALALSRELGAEGKQETAQALDLLGELATEVGEYEQAPSFFEEALAIYRELQKQPGIAEMLMQLGWAAMRVGNYSQASDLLKECLALFREQGETRQLGFAFAGLGELSVRQGDYERASEFLEQSLSLRQELGDRWAIATTLGSLGWVAMLERDFKLMRALLGESLSLRMEIGESGGAAWCLEKLAQGISLEVQNLTTAYRLRGLQRAARLLGAAEALRLPVNSTIDPADLFEYETLLAQIKAGLGQEGFDSAWAEGRGMPIPETVALGLAPLLTNAELASLSAFQSAKARYGGLSPRERETAVLITQGKANREIAEIMFVRLKTVETYVTRILNKLGFDSRVQIATWAHEVGLMDEDLPAG